MLHLDEQLNILPLENEVVIASVILSFAEENGLIFTCAGVLTCFSRSL